MSYDVYMAVDTGGEELHIEPYFDDVHPDIGYDSGGMTAVVTASGYARCGNYTSNVSGMWTRCLSAAAAGTEWWRWVGDDDVRLRERYEHMRDRPVDTSRLTLRDLEGKTGEELAPLMARAVEWGIEHLAELHESDPSNGWGDADGAVTFLWDIQRMCERHPKARLHISS